MQRRGNMGVTNFHVTVLSPGQWRSYLKAKTSQFKVRTEPPSIPPGGAMEQWKAHVSRLARKFKVRTDLPKAKGGPSSRWLEQMRDLVANTMTRTDQPRGVNYLA